MMIYNIVITEPDVEYAISQNSNEIYTSFPLQGKESYVSTDIFRKIKEKGVVLSNVVSDLLDIAVAVYTTDQIISRELHGFQGWSRHLKLHLPVSDTFIWDNVKADLQLMLEFLSGDKWELEFRNKATIKPFQKPLILNPNNISTVSLFSGGLDSCIEAINLLENGAKPFFISHYKRGSEHPAQIKILSSFIQKYGDNTFESLQFYVQPNQRMNNSFKESTSRARSFLFLCLGIAISESLGENIPLIVPENGLISLNIPLTYTRVSSHSTRTTHPFYLMKFREVLNGLGIKNKISNPHQFETKGEMILNCKNKNYLKKVYKETISCSHPDNSRFKKGSRPGIHCGYCVPCIIRQAATKRAGWPDDDYAYNIHTDPPANHLKKARDLRAYRIALEKFKSLKPHSIILQILRSGPLNFLDKSELDNYTQVYKRGMEEVDSFLN